MKKVHPKKFLPKKNPPEPRNSGIFSNSGQGQKLDPPMATPRARAILKKAVDGHRNTTAKKSTK